MKAVCFDLDGTICDLWEGEGNARTLLIEIIANESGKEVDEIASLYDAKWTEIKREYMNWVAKGLDEVDLREKHLNTLFHELGLTLDAKDLAELHCKTTMDGILIFSDARDVLRDMGGKYRLCMITNGPPLWQREKIEVLSIGSCFEEVIVSGELGHHKPSPVIFNEMTKRMNVEPSEIIYIGNDYRKDIMGADAAGWKTAWVNRENGEIGEVTPTFEIKELSDLKL